MATLDSIFEKRINCIDKLKSILIWLRFGNPNFTFTCYDDIVTVEDMANRFIVAAAMKSMDRNIINEAVFENKQVNLAAFNNAVTPIPDNNLSLEMRQMNDDIINVSRTDRLQSWLMAKDCLAEGKITYVVTRRIYVEFDKYATTRNQYLSTSKLISEEEGLQVAQNFETFLVERGYTPKSLKRKRE